jgi:hypothetical protein
MEPAKPVRGVAGGLSERIRDAVGEWRHSGFYYILGALLLLLPLWWRFRAAWFSLVFCGVAWIWMALTHDAGASAHHVVLLWPFPILFASAALRRMPGFALFLAGLAMAGSNLLVTNQYFYQFQRYGAYGTFTDAIFPLSQALDDTAGNTVYVIDWGMFDSLNLLHRGRLKLRNASGSLTPEKPSPSEVEDVERMLLDPQGVFVGHVKGQEAFERVGEHLDARAQAAGFRREILRTIPDTNGRPMFEISRVVSIN